jgi:hypothetical protein
MKPAAAGDQTLTMNSQRSASTPVLAGLSQPMQAKGKSEAYTDELNSAGLAQNIGQATKSPTAGPA